MLEQASLRGWLVVVVALAACGGTKETKKASSDEESVDKPAHREKKHGAADASATAAASSSAAQASSASAAPPAGAPSDMVEVLGGSIAILGFNDKPSKADVATFSMDRTEVSVAEYRKCVAGGACKAPTEISLDHKSCNFQMTDHEDHPINCVYHDEAAAYCKSVGKRLPKLEEWELAAAGPEGRVFPWGNDKATKDIACYSQTGGTCKIGSHPKGNTPSGIQDLAGNVYEETEVQDCIGTPPAGTPCRQSFDLLMGGTWNKFESDSVKSKKVGQTVGTPPETIGFRCVK